MSHFFVVPGAAVSTVLAGAHKDVLRIVAETYVAHEQGLSVNPDSYFLRFPDKPNARVIALPSYLGGEVDTIGMKWIASFPDNIKEGLPRASATLLLNDYATGYPLACLEAAGISAVRTAASAAVAASELITGTEPVRLAVVGAGVIARTIIDYLHAGGVQVAEVLVHDLDATSAGHLSEHAAARFGVPVSIGTLDDALDRDLVVFATTAAAPYVPADTALRPGQVLLNVSLRDIAPELLLGSNNIVDDVDHCLKAQTSPHLAEQLTGGREFITGTLGALLQGDVTIDPDKPTVFSPFGLGILDLAVGHHVLHEAKRQGSAIDIPDFIGETKRW
ncbi:2,3-diaminopropionate biosynthesis protein SbnB [Streptomyces zagrosensis]|uniref:2,3-diaminopropionate biosynthesis protein SbnB n=1 Tax=Streptomyces zagrosensis TaxID=1042984 RepID=A0A7W9Q7F7_9ACTN|nr:2,3-diaminopropionate biosynthesis protein SbnB [Streptomyces zagrosensis]MBB5935018.1 2,3-diaminopropionate biosynthesis protein SbnB [Streptomyces zagrosensis]